MVIETIIQSIRSRIPARRDSAQLLQGLIDGRYDLRELVNELVSIRTYQHALDTMADLEWLASDEADLALILMVGLYDIADELRAHDLCDAIELWLENSGSQPLIAALETQTRQGNVSIAKSAEWVSMLARNANS